MKKFVLFAFHNYYPAGGMDDLKDSYETEEEARAAAEDDGADDFQIVDRDSWALVATGARSKRHARIAWDRQ
jgi:hypothetical protein